MTSVKISDCYELVEFQDKMLLLTTLDGQKIVNDAVKPFMGKERKAHHINKKEAIALAHALKEWAENDDGSECICSGNWRLIIKESEQYFGQEYQDEHGVVFIFDSVTWAGDDFYYLMFNPTAKQYKHLSCVGSIENHGYERVERQASS